MARICNTERGARIALSTANSVLSSHFEPSLFPQRLSRKLVAFWKEIAEAATDQMEECQAMREAGRG